MKSLLTSLLTEVVINLYCQVWGGYVADFDDESYEVADPHYTGAKDTSAAV